MPGSETTVRYLGWAVDRPDRPLYVQYGGTEAEAWKIALGWPSQEEITHAKENGGRAFPIEIREAIKHANSDAPPNYRRDAEWMATYIMGRLPDHNTTTAAEIAEYEEELRAIVERVVDGIGEADGG